MYELERAQNQRSQMVYNSEKGFVYQANDQDIKAAEEQLDQIRHEQAVAVLEKQISTLQDSINVLNDKIEDVQDEIDVLNDKIEALQDEIEVLDEHIEAIEDEIEVLDNHIEALEDEIEVLDGTIEALEDEMDALDGEIERLEGKITDLEAELDVLLAKYDEQIKGLEKYSDAIGHCADVYTEAQEDMAAAALWGSDYKNKILEGDMKLIKDFEQDYKDAQSAQAVASKQAANDVVEAYKKRVDALNEWKRAQEEAAQTSFNVSSLDTSSSVNTKTNESNVKARDNKPNLSEAQAKAIMREFVDKTRANRKKSYGSGTDNAKPGYHEIAESGDEIVLDNYGNAYLAEGHQLHRFEGGEKVFDAIETRELLRGKYLPIDSIFPDYSSMLSKVVNNTVSNAFTPSAPVINGRNKNQPMKVDNSIHVTVGDIHVTEVDNASQIAKAITNQLPNALLQELNRK